MFAWLSKYIAPHKTTRSSLARFNQTSSPMWTPVASSHHHTSPHDAVARFGSWAYAAAMLNAHAVATVPLRLYVRKRQRHKLYRTRPLSHTTHRYLAGDHPHRIRPSTSVLHKVADWRSDFEEVTEAHPALSLLSGNIHTTGFELTVLRMLYLQITGSALLHTRFDDTLARPTELHLLPTQWTTTLHDKSNLLQGYAFGSSAADKRIFAPHEIIHWKLPNLHDPSQGQSRIEAALGALDLHHAKRLMDLARYHNHARPDYLLIVKQGATAEALDRFEKQVDAKLRGVKQSGKFITISGDVHATPLNFQSDTLGDTNRVLEEIAACFGVPISKLLANDPNKAGAQTADTAWLRDTILPYCRLDEEKLNQAYLPLFGIQDDAFLAYDNPVPEDRHQEVQRRVAFVSAGIMTRNEARAEEGLPPLPDGDTLTA